MKIRSRAAFIPSISIAILAFAGPVLADCVYPKAPATIPDGSKATEQEMMSAMETLREYNNAVSAYLSCLDLETSTRITDAGPNVTSDQVKQIRAMEAKKHNAAVDELQSHADEFNKQVRAYKTRKKG